jgi:hypothetical protein
MLPESSAAIGVCMTLSIGLIASFAQAYMAILFAITFIIKGVGVIYF